MERLNSAMFLQARGLCLIVLMTKVFSWVVCRNNTRSPVSDKLLRAPGESLLRKMEAQDEQIAICLFILFFLPIFAVWQAPLQSRSTFIGIGIVFMAACLVPLARLI